MANIENIEASQFKKMVSLFIVGTSIILAPAMLTAEAKQDAWISALIGVMAGMLLVVIYNALGSMFPGRTLVELSREVFGFWLGTIGSLLMFAYSFLLTSLVLRNLGDFLTSSMFPETPIGAIHFVYLVIVMIGIRYGLPNIARTVDILFPWVLYLFFLFIILISPQLEWKHVQPVLAKGVKPILFAAYPYIGFPFLELVLFLMILPSVKDAKEARKGFLLGPLLGGFILFTITLLSILVLGGENTASEIYPSFELAKKIELGVFIQRVEAIMAVMWFLTIYVKLLICFYMTVLCLSQTLGLPEYRSIALPLGLILFALSIFITPNLGYLLSFDMTVWPLYACTFGLLYPLLLLGVGAIRRKLC